MTRTVRMHVVRFAQAIAAVLALVVAPLATGVVLALALPPLAAADDVALDARQTRVFATICARCHVRPGIGAPVVGDDDAWAPRRAKGADVLLTHTITGFRDMPPLGTCGFCDEDDFRRLVAAVAGLPAASPAAAPQPDTGSKP